MGFIKNFRRDFAQAVNELLPDGEEKAGKKKKESRQNAEDAELLRPAADVKPQEPVRDANVQDAVSEALLREEADQLRDEIRQNTEQRVMEMNRELDEEIDSLPDVDASESEEDDAAETDETFDIGSGYEAESEYEEDPEDDFDEDSEDDLEDDSEDDLDEETDIESDELSEEAYEAELLSGEAISEYEVEEVHEPETLYDLDAAEVTGDKDIAFPESTEEDPTASGMSDVLTSDKYTEAKMPEDPEAESAGAGEPSEGFDSEPKEEAEEFRKESEVSRLAELEAQAGLNDAISGLAADCTYITAKTKITGDIETEGDIDLIGTVYGNIDCAGKLIVGGTISGEVKAKELYANQAKIEGPVSVTDDVKIGVGSVIIGKITGSSAVIAGAVNGDIDIQGPVIVDSTAVIVGNIKSKSVQINSGAIIEGFCSQAYLDVDVKKYFSMEEAHTASEEMKIEELMPEASEITGEDAKDIKEDVTEKLSRDEKTHSGNGSNRNKNKNRNHSGKNQE